MITPVGLLRSASTPEIMWAATIVPFRVTVPEEFRTPAPEFEAVLFAIVESVMSAPVSELMPPPI